MNVFLQNMLGILPVLGIHAFERSQSPRQRNEYITLYCQARGVRATGRDTPQGFIVEAGSQATLDETPSLQQHFSFISETRSELRQNGVLAATDHHLTFTQDYAFSSPSTAAAVVLRRSSNGRVAWKDESGRTLKEIQEAQAVKINNEDASTDPANDIPVRVQEI